MVPESDDYDDSDNVNMSCDVVAVAVERHRSVHLQRQSRCAERLSPECSEHVRRRRLPVWTANDSTQAMHHQVCRQITQPVAPRSAGAGAVGC